MDALKKGCSYIIMFIVGSIILCIGTVTFLLNENAKAMEIAHQERLNPCPTTNERPATLLFASRVADEFDEVPNDYLILFYRGSEEIARSTSNIGQFTLFEDSTDPTDDGYFQLETDNPLQVAACDFVSADFEFRHLDYYNRIALVGYAETLPVNRPITISVPSKNFSYTIWIIPTPIPEEINSTATVFNNGAISVIEQTIETVDLDNMGLSIEFIELPEKTYVTIPGTVREDEINNCGGNVAQSRNFEKSQSYVYDFRVDAGAVAVLPMAFLNAAVRTQLYYEEGRMESETTNMPIIANPGEHIQFELFWQEIWQPYTLEVTDIRSNTITQYNFDVKLGVKLESTTSKVSC